MSCRLVGKCGPVPLHYASVPSGNCGHSLFVYSDFRQCTVESDEQDLLEVDSVSTSVDQMVLGTDIAESIHYKSIQDVIILFGPPAYHMGN